jgi:hypothetical protein
MSSRQELNTKAVIDLGEAQLNRRRFLQIAGLTAADLAAGTFLVSCTAESREGPRIVVTPAPGKPVRSTENPAQPAPNDVEVNPSTVATAVAGDLVVVEGQVGGMLAPIGSGETLSIRPWEEVLAELEQVDFSLMGIEGAEIKVFTDRSGSEESVSSLVVNRGNNSLIIPLVGPDKHGDYDFEPTTVPAQWKGFAPGRSKVAVLDTWGLFVSEQSVIQPTDAVIFQKEDGYLGVLVRYNNGVWVHKPEWQCPEIQEYNIDKPWGELTDRQQKNVQTIAVLAGPQYNLNEVQVVRSAISLDLIKVDGDNAWSIDSENNIRVLALNGDGQDMLGYLPNKAENAEYKEVEGVGNTWAWEDKEGNHWYWDFAEKTIRPLEIKKPIYSFELLGTTDIPIDRLEWFMVGAKKAGKHQFKDRVFKTRVFSQDTTVCLSQEVKDKLLEEDEDINIQLALSEWAEIARRINEDRFNLQREVPISFDEKKTMYFCVEDGKPVVYVFHNNYADKSGGRKNLFSAGFKAELVGGQVATIPVPTYPSLPEDGDYRWREDEDRAYNIRFFEQAESGPVLVAENGLEVQAEFRHNVWHKIDLALERPQIIQGKENQAVYIENALGKEHTIDGSIVVDDYPKPICIAYSTPATEKTHGFSKGMARFFAQTLQGIWNALPVDSEAQQKWLEAAPTFIVKDRLRPGAVAEPCHVERMWGVVLQDRYYQKYDVPAEEVATKIRFLRYYFHEVARIWCEWERVGEAGNDDKVKAIQDIFYRAAAKGLNMTYDEFINYRMPNYNG